MECHKGTCYTVWRWNVRHHFLSTRVREMHVHATVGVMVRSGRYIVAQTPRSVTDSEHTFGVYAFHRCYCFEVKTFLYTMRRIPEKPPCFGSGSAHVRNFRNFSQRQSPLTTTHVFATEIMKILCLQLELVYFSYNRRNKKLS